MPTTTQIGQPGPANDRIGGIPRLHYFDLSSRGRGQAIRLLFLDAGICFTDVRYTFEEFGRDVQASLMASPDGLNPTGSLPVVELDGGEAMTQSYPILRHFSRVLGNVYDGGDGGDDEEAEAEAKTFWVDRICDVVIDWRTRFVDSYFSTNRTDDYTRHCEHTRPRYMKALERHLTENRFANRGPFVAGQKFTYADIVLYQLLHDEELAKGDLDGLEHYPRLKKVVEAVTARPNIKAFLESDEYKG